VHVPLVVDADGERLAKRDGVPLTLTELAAVGVGPSDVVGWIVRSLGYDGPRSFTTLRELVDVFDPSSIPPGPCSVPDFARPR
jgi:glutamyl-tRNA synthetase